MTEDIETKYPRRRFLCGVIGGTTTLITALIALPGVGLIFAPLLHRPHRKRAKLLFISPDESASTSFILVRYEGQDPSSPGIFVKRSAQGKVVALSAKCTHAGCGVEWRSDQNRFICPCHQGQFDAEGKNISGPPPRPLDHMTVDVEGNDIFVEVSQA